MILWLIIQLLVITSFIAGYLLGGNKRIAIGEVVEKLKDVLPKPKYKVFQKKPPQTHDEKTLEQLEKNFNANKQDKE